MEVSGKAELRFEQDKKESVMGKLKREVQAEKITRANALKDDQFGKVREAGA